MRWSEKNFSRVGLAALLAVFAAACFGSHEDIDGAGGSLAPGDEPELRLLVELNDYSAGLAAIRGAGGQVKLEIPARGLVSVTLPDEAITALRRNPAVDSISVDQVRRPMSTETVPWGITRVQAEGTSVVGDKMVCIIDGGYYTGHEDLPSTVTGEPEGWNTSECAHGTHVAGTIAAVDNEVGVVGVLPNTVPIHAVQVFSGTDCRWTYTSGLIAAVDACVAAGADVINMSLGGGGPSEAEEQAFIDAFAAGVLPFAAAGNDGTPDLLYPASYSSVISVGATDSSDARAGFSQHNEQVELSAPGVGVLSTVQYATNNTVNVGGDEFVAGVMEGARDGTATGALVDGGTCNTEPGRNEYRGQIVLCERGVETFRTKVENASTGGAAGVIVYNNVAGGFGGGLGGGKKFNFPIVTLSQEDGQALVLRVGESATVTSEIVSPASGYDTFNGTSMATPHAAGVAALVWTAAEAEASALAGTDVTFTAQEIRTALAASAANIGGNERDNDFGHGLVQVDAALAHLADPLSTLNCAPTPGEEVVETSCDDGLDNDCDGETDGVPGGATGDTDCTGGSDPDPAPECKMPKDPCESPTECCFGICSGPEGRRKCR